MLLSLPLGYARLRSYVEAGWGGRVGVVAAADADSGGLCRSNSQSFSSEGRGAITQLRSTQPATAAAEPARGVVRGW
jgi:hypothetical protein